MFKFNNTRATKKTKNPHIGSSHDDFLDEQGMLEECEHQALKEILADQVRKAMEDIEWWWMLEAKQRNLASDYA